MARLLCGSVQCNPFLWQTQVLAKVCMIVLKSCTTSDILNNKILQEDIMEIYLQPWMKFATADGRASKREYWTFVLINLAVSIALNILAKQIGLISIVGLLFSLAIFIPSVAVGIRRLHDSGKTGWLLLIGVIPVLGWLALLYLMLQDSDGNNAYGAPPSN